MAASGDAKPPVAAATAASELSGQETQPFTTATKAKSRASSQRKVEAIRDKTDQVIDSFSDLVTEVECEVERWDTAVIGEVRRSSGLVNFAGAFNNSEQVSEDLDEEITLETPAQRPSLYCTRQMQRNASTWGPQIRQVITTGPGSTRQKQGRLRGGQLFMARDVQAVKEDITSQNEGDHDAPPKIQVLVMSVIGLLILVRCRKQEKITRVKQIVEKRVRVPGQIYG